MTCKLLLHFMYYLKISRRMNVIQFFRAVSRVYLNDNVSKTVERIL
jgi:hypothetical protein